MSTDRAISRSALVMALGFLAANTLSLVKEVVTTATFGVGTAMDAYFIALTVPTFFLLFTGGLGDAFVPAMVRLMGSGSEERARDFHDRYVSWVILYALAAILLINAAAPWLVPLLSAGAPPETQRLATKLVRLLSFLVLLDSLAAVTTMTYHGRRRFAVPSFTPMVVTLTTVLAMLTLHRSLGIYSLVVGLLAGSALSVAIMTSLLPRDGVPFRFRVDLRDDEVRGVVRQSLPLMATRLLSQANGIVDKVMAAFLSVGSVSVLGWASRMYGFCYQMFIYSVYRVLIPHFSAQVAREDWPAVRATLDRALRFSALVLLPIMGFIGVLSNELIRSVFERGSFTPEATQLTAAALRYSILGLLCEAANSIFYAVLLALRETNRVFLVGAVGFLPNILLNFWFMHSLQAPGIALSTSVVSGIFMVALYRVTRKRVGAFLQHGFALYLLKVAAAALAAALLSAAVSRGWGVLLGPLTPGMRLASWALVAPAGAAGYFATLSLLRVRELGALVALLRPRAGARP